jgi:hypothetical protein
VLYYYLRHPWLSCILHEGLWCPTLRPLPTEDVIEAVTANPFVTAVVRRAGRGETIGLQSPDRPLGAKVPSTMTTFGETLPHLLIANPSPGQSRRHCPPEANPSSEKQLLKMDALIVNRKTCIEGMVDLMEVATILNGAQLSFYS